MNIIPAINALSYEEAKGQFEKIRTTGAQRLHLDIVDGKFAPNITWGSPQELARLFRETGFELSFEVHLMTENTERSLESWCASRPERIIVHEEAMTDVHFAAAACTSCDAELMIALRPETPVEKLERYREITKAFQMLAVTPGKAGQKFQESVIHKIEALRKQLPNAIIEVDGGVTPEVAMRCKEAGADDFVSASFILSHTNPNIAYETLLSAIA